LPVDGEPADVVARVEAYDRWLTSTPDVPKLLLTFDPGPGTMVSGPLVDWCKQNIAGLEVQPCGLAGHHAPEDQPDCIGGALVAWIVRHGLQFGVGVGS
jgi:haloalkane dehalogenase